MKKLLVVILLVSFLFVFGSIASAQSFRCGNFHVLKGDVKQAVYESCGIPKSKAFVGMGLEKWVYLRGNYAYILYFEAGILTKLEQTRTRRYRSDYQSSN
jgi:hypothetical protein